MRKIDTLAELRAERKRLRQKQLVLEKEIENNFSELKESFAPAQLITNGAAKMLVNKNHGLVNEVVSLVTDFLLKNTLLRNAGFITRFIIPLITRNTANNLLHDNKTKVLGWIGDLILKMGNRKNHTENYDTTTAGANY